jgi:hypothetical protein
MSTFLDVTVGTVTFRSRLLDDSSPGACAELLANMPIDGQVVQDEWSQDVMEVSGSPTLSVPSTDTPRAFQHPGLLVADQDTGRLWLCFGQGRLQDGFGPLRTVPVAQLGGDLSSLVRLGRGLHVDGATSIRIQRAANQIALLTQPEPKGRRLTVTLGEARVSAVLLEDISPRKTTALARLLPLVGSATNTVSSGPLTRFWNPAGGPEGETVLDDDSADGSQGSQDPDDPGQQILYPGVMYYLPSRPWRGLRTAFREATIMKGVLPGDSPSLIPLAQFVGAWSEAGAVAERLRFTGSTPMRIEFDG